jgi:biopolymer transport protein ExbD
MSQGISIDLPGASESTSQATPKSYRIALNENGEVYLDSKKVSLDELSQKLTEIKAAGSKEDAITLWADKAVEHGKVVTVMDRVRASGIESLAVATRPLPKQ